MDINNKSPTKTPNKTQSSDSKSPLSGLDETNNKFSKIVMNYRAQAKIDKEQEEIQMKIKEIEESKDPTLNLNFDDYRKKKYENDP